MNSSYVADMPVVLDYLICNFLVLVRCTQIKKFDNIEVLVVFDGWIDY